MLGGPKPAYSAPTGADSDAGARRLGGRIVANEANRRERTRAESQANKFSPARVLFVGPNSAPNPDAIPPIEALAAPGVRIHPAPPHSLYPINLLRIRFGIARETGQFSYLAPPETAGFEPRRENF